jgi:hypothetical protein
MAQPWSRVKKQLEARLCASAQGRVEFHMARYRASHDESKRCWITVDGDEWISFADYQASPEAQRLGLPKETRSSFSDEEREAVFQVLGVGYGALGWWAQDVLENYLSESLERAISSREPLTRGLAYLDARYGKRRLEKEPDKPDDKFTAGFLVLRLRLESEHKP